jgi:hypothetical protein
MAFKYGAFGRSRSRDTSVGNHRSRLNGSELRRSSTIDLLERINPWRLRRMRIHVYPCGCRVALAAEEVLPTLPEFLSDFR